MSGKSLLTHVKGVKRSTIEEFGRPSLEAPEKETLNRLKEILRSSVLRYEYHFQEKGIIQIFKSRRKVILSRHVSESLCIFGHLSPVDPNTPSSPHSCIWYQRVDRVWSGRRRTLLSIDFRTGPRTSLLRYP